MAIESREFKMAVGMYCSENAVPLDVQEEEKY